MPRQSDNPTPEERLADIDEVLAKGQKILERITDPQDREWYMNMLKQYTDERDSILNMGNTEETEGTV